MQSRTLLLISLAALAASAAPASAADVDMARLCADEVTINDVQECAVWAEAAAQRAIDNTQSTCGEAITVNEAQRCLTNAEEIAQGYVDTAQDLVKTGLELVCDIACNALAVSSSVSTPACGDEVSINEAEECLNYADQTARRTVQEGQDTFDSLYERYLCKTVCPSA
ncbi:MAG: hypothetical protein WC876_08270 [Candidatus Thermoplasmatota archaeon]|jgi:hypothetical protein